MRQRQSGYSLIELMVALSVTSVVLAGTYAAYTFFAQQQQTLLAQTEVERGALRVVDLMQSDIRMAGFKDYGNVNPQFPAQAIVIGNAGDDLSVVYDVYDTSNNPYPVLVHYYLANHTSQSGTRKRLKRDYRQCINPAVACNVLNSTSVISSDGDGPGEPILDWVTSYSVKGLNTKLSGTFLNQYQVVQVTLVVSAPQKIEGTTRQVSKTFTFLARAKNVSLVF